MLQGLVYRVVIVGGVSVGLLIFGAVGPAAAQTPSPTSITTSLSDGSSSSSSLTVPLSTRVTDSATLAGAGVATAGGTVTYLIFSDSKCTKIVDDSQVTVTDGVVPSSAPETFSKAGSYYWTAVYSGDANNAGSTESCGSELETVASGPIVDTSSDTATCQASAKLTFDPPLVKGGTATDVATLAAKVSNWTVSGSASVVVKSATWQGTLRLSDNACTALASLPSMSSTIAFSTTPTMKSNSTDVVFNAVTYSGSTLGDTGAVANAASGTAPFEGSDQGTSSGFALTTSTTATQATATCTKKAKGLKSITIKHGDLSLM